MCSSGKTRRWYSRQRASERFWEVDHLQVPRSDIFCVLRYPPDTWHFKIESTTFGGRAKSDRSVSLSLSLSQEKLVSKTFFVLVSKTYQGTRHFVCFAYLGKKFCLRRNRKPVEVSFAYGLNYWRGVHLATFVFEADAVWQWSIDDHQRWPPPNK